MALRHAVLFVIWASSVAAQTNPAAAPLSVAPSADVCAAAPPSTRTVVRDSAGIRIVENHILPGVVLQRIGVDSSPDMRAEMPDGDKLISSGARLTNGSIVVVEPWPQPRIRLFGNDGKLIRPLLNVGTDRSQFGWNVLLTRLTGDTLILNDVDNRRLTYITPQSQIVKVVQLPPKSGTRAPDDTPGFAGILPDGGVLGSRVVRPLESRGSGRPVGTTPPLWFDTLPVVWRDTLYVHRLKDASIEWEAPDVLLGGSHFIDYVGLGSGPISGVPPFGIRESLASGPDGFFHGNGDSYSISRYRSVGKRDLIVRLCRQNMPVTAAEIRHYKDSVIASSRTAQGRVHAELLVNTLPYPAQWSAFLSLRADASGRLWVREPGTAARNEWLVFSRDGVLQASASLPSLVMYIDGEYLLNGPKLYRLRVR